MMVSNRLTEIPTQIICSDDVHFEGATLLQDTQAFEGILPIQKQTISIVELGRRLRKCARLGNTEQVHDLMTKGAPFTTDWLGTSALHLAAMNNHLETCEILLRAGISRDARTKVERTPLHLAAYEGHVKICELLLLNKAEIDPRDMLRMTPLHWAVEKQHDAVVELLLQHGADPTLSSKFDKTPISIAVELNRLDLAHLLQLAARLLSQQADLANAENEANNVEATLAATQSLEQTLELQGDIVDTETTTILPVECKTELIEETQASDSMGNTIADELPEMNETVQEEPQILKNPANITSPSQLSTLQLLQAHGITMLPTDEGGLVNNAIQSGRTLVLSEAGKLVLAEGKKNLIDKSTIPVIKPTPRKQIVIPNSSLKNKKVITLTHDQFMAITKSQGNKPLLKKVSAEAFKKAAENAGVKYSVIPPLKSTPVITYSSPKVKRISLSPTKDPIKTPMKVINPVAVSGILTGNSKATLNITSIKTQLDELQKVKSELKDAQAQIERLKMLLNAKDTENKRLNALIQEMKPKDDTTID